MIFFLSVGLDFDAHDNSRTEAQEFVLVLKGFYFHFEELIRVCAF